MQRIFALFRSSFVRNRDFTGKNAKLGREICIKLKIDKVGTKCGVRQMITITCFTYVQKEF